MTFTPRAWKGGLCERQATIFSRTAHHRHLRHAGVHPDSGDPPALAAYRDDERILGRRRSGHLAGGGGEHLLPAAERRAAAISLCHGTGAAVTTSAQASSQPLSTPALSGGLATMHP